MPTAPPYLRFVITALAVAGCSTVPPGKTEPKLVKFVKEWKGSFSNEEDETLIKYAGHIPNDKAWAKVWKAWRGNEELPKIDFENQLVIATAAKGPKNILLAHFTISDKGDLRGGLESTKEGGPGFVYLIVVMDRAGIKTCHGVDVEKVYPSSRPNDR